MGAAASKNSASGTTGDAPDAAWPGGPSAKDYYALLGIEETAGETEIRKAFRKLALVHHPDKNRGNEEEANRRFHLIQAAYEVLSDEQERAWYDTHRSDDLADEEEEEVDPNTFHDLRTGKTQQAPAKASAPGLTVRQLMKFFDPGFAAEAQLRPAVAESSGFYGTYRRLFERLAEEERIATPYPGEDNGGPAEYPPFGGPDDPYVQPRESAGLRQARDFYDAWLNFHTRKSFGWADLYRASDAPDRRLKRLMEKDNKKARDRARREYNDTVHALASFVRKRDPRFQAYAKRMAAEPSAQQKRQQQARDEAARRQQERQEAAAKYAAERQAWEEHEAIIDSEFDSSDGEDLEQRSADSESRDADGVVAIDGKDEEGAGVDSSDPEDEWENPDQFTCFACDKFFRSDAALRNHEQSKKHHQQVKRLQREMKADDEKFNFNEDDLAQETQKLSLNEPFTMGTSKKAKKKAKAQRKAAAAAAALQGSDEEVAPIASHGAPTPGSAEEALWNSPLYEKMHADLLAAPAIRASDLPILTSRPPGSFDVFGYGSLIFRPPPHVIGATPGFIKGYARRFAQASIDHRGTPARPGRVVTLVTAKDWHERGGEEPPEGDIVWGYSFTIDPVHAEAVKGYLDWREKNGYTETRVTVWKTEAERVLDNVLVYVGLPDNPAFVGPEPVAELAERIFTTSGPSGRNDEYLLRTAEAVRHLGDHVKDSYLFELEERVLAMRAGDAAGQGLSESVPPDAVAAAVAHPSSPGTPTQPVKKSKKKNRRR